MARGGADLGRRPPRVSGRNRHHHQSASAVRPGTSWRARPRPRPLRALADQHVSRRVAGHGADRTRGLRRRDRWRELPRLHRTDPGAAPAARQHRHCRQSRGPQGRRHPTRHPGCRVRPRRDHWRGGPRASATSTGGVAAAARAPRLPPHGRAASPSGRKAGWRASVDDQSLIAIGVDRSVWLDARGEDVPGTLLGPVQRARVHGPVRRPVEPCRPGLPVANACLGQRAARPPAARASVGAVAVVALVVHGPAGPHGGAGAPAELALRTGALGRHSWLPTHRRPVAAAHSPCLSRPPERMWTDAACPRPPPRRDPAHDPAQNRLDRHPR